MSLAAKNVTIWAISSLASFVFPLIIASLTAGDAAALRSTVQIVPLIVGMLLSTKLITSDPKVADPAASASV